MKPKALFCPCCGWPTDTALMNVIRVFTISTCRHQNCALYGATLSERSISDPKTMAAWHVTPKFDPNTGRELSSNAAH